MDSILTAERVAYIMDKSVGQEISYDVFALGRSHATLCKRTAELEAAIKSHRSQRADDRCIEDDDRLYAVLGDDIKCDRRVGDKEAMLKNCARFIERRCEGGQWPSYASLVDGIRHGANMATELWVQLGEEGPLADAASMISAHLIGTILSEDGLETP